ncbi:MAG: hypothetical protein SGILL_000597 [Bacillariaceae sp.]
MSTASLWLSFLTVALTMIRTSADGTQTGPSDGPFYAGGMIYDKSGEFVYLTGIHYTDELDDGDQLQLLGVTSTSQSNCLIATIDLGFDDGEFEAMDDWETFGSDSILESCHSLALHNPDQLIVVGSVEPGSALVDTDPSIPLSGMAMMVDKNVLSADSQRAFPLTSTLDSTNRLLYPMSVVSDGNDNVYVAALTSTDSTEVSQTSPFPNWQELQKFGSSMDMTILKLSISTPGAVDGIPTGDSTFIEEWTQEFPVDVTSGGTPPRVYLGGLVYKQDSTSGQEYLIIAGSTRGLGDAYGSGEGDDEDGFLTVLDPATGELHAGTTNTKREGTAEDDIVTGICDDPTAEDTFYIVGATKGGGMGTAQATDADLLSQLPNGSLQPFVRRVSVSDLSAVWTNQWIALPPQSSTPGLAYAMGCMVDDGNLYVTGTVKDGASMVQGSKKYESQGGDDVWISKMDKASGIVEWMTQLGSSGNDKVARYGSVVTDTQGNPLLFGDTTGSLYRQRGSETATDMFVMSLNEMDGTIMDEDFVGGISTTSGETGGVVPPNDTQGGDEVDGIPVGPTDQAPTQPTAPVPVAPTEGAPTYAPVPLPAEGHQFKSIGLQITEPGHAGGIVYNDISNSVLLAGATFVDDVEAPSQTSMCFTGQVNLDTGNLESKFSHGSVANQESCSAVAFDHAHNMAFAIGSVEVGSAAGFSSAWDSVAGMAQAGAILQTNDKMGLIGGNNMVGHSVIYPVAVVSDPRVNTIHVASMVSDDSSVASNPGGEDDDGEYPNYTAGNRRDFGSRFQLSVQQYSFDTFSNIPTDPVTDSVKLDWENIFAPTSGSITVSGMTLAGNGNALIVVGSTKASGGVFEENDGDDMDGFILKVDPNTGELYQGTDGTERGSTRLDSVNKQDDYILQVCNDRFDHNAFYVVGTSGGKVRNIPDEQQAPAGSMHAFVAKIQVQGLNASWLKHFTMSIPGNGQVFGEALACTVTHDDDGKNIVYVGGTIRGGAMVDGAPLFNGGDDIFVASMDGATGDVKWIQQIGTPQNDRLAAGKGLDVDAFGNVIVFGETQGDMYGANDGSNNIVVFTMNKMDGSHLPPRSIGPGIGIDTPADVPEEDPSASLLPDNVVAIQSGPDVGPSYAGGMAYDPFSNALYVTGATYGAFSPGRNGSPASNCFFGIVTLPTLAWKEQSVFGTDNVAEACSAIALADYKGKTEVMLGGTTEPGGLLSGLSGNNDEQYGVILDVSNSGGSYELLGGDVLDQSSVQFPISVLTDEDTVFVAAMASTDETVRADFEKANREYPNFTTGGIEKYGSAYSIVVERHTIDRGRDAGSGVLESTMSLDWRKPFETADGRSVFVSAMALVDDGDALVVVGSTREEGEDFDGIMAKVDVADGNFESESENSRSVAYFASIAGKDDYINGACVDPDDSSVFYIVGGTEGDTEGNGSTENIDAIVAKIKTETLEIMWSKQIYVIPSPGSGTADAYALGCDVVRGTGFIYVAGNVENSAVIENDDDPQQSFGGDDIFVGMLETKSGDLVWLKQVGSPGEDRVAHGGGVKADQHGNAVVYGDTTGEFYRIRNNDQDSSFSNIFLMVFNQADGTHVPPYHTGWTQATASFFSDPKYLAFAITAVVMIFLSLFFFCYARHTQRKRADAQKSSIFAYLQAFDVEDIDLRKSPPGGWHGTYLNKLAYGINKADVSSGEVPEVLETANPSPASSTGTVEMAPLTMTTHSSIVKDSLFMDTMSTPSLGGQDYYDDLSHRSERSGSFRGGMTENSKIV